MKIKRYARVLTLLLVLGLTGFGSSGHAEKRAELSIPGSVTSSNSSSSSNLQYQLASEKETKITPSNPNVYNLFFIGLN